MTPKQAHADIAVACLDYLMLAFSVAECAELYEQRVEDFKFLCYAAQMWPHHAREAGEEDKKIPERFGELAASPNNMEFAYQIFNCDSHLDMGEYMPITYQLCCFGLEKLAIKSLPEPDTEQFRDMNKRLPTGDHLLHEVAHVGFLKLLDVMLEEIWHRHLDERRGWSDHDELRFSGRPCRYGQVLDKIQVLFSRCWRSWP